MIGKGYPSLSFFTYQNGFRMPTSLPVGLAYTTTRPKILWSTYIYFSFRTEDKGKTLNLSSWMPQGTEQEQLFFWTIRLYTKCVKPRFSRRHPQNTDNNPKAMGSLCTLRTGRDFFHMQLSIVFLLWYLALDSQVQSPGQKTVWEALQLIPSLDFPFLVPCPSQHLLSKWIIPFPHLHCYLKDIYSLWSSAP